MLISNVISCMRIRAEKTAPARRAKGDVKKVIVREA